MNISIVVMGDTSDIIQYDIKRAEHLMQHSI